MLTELYNRNFNLSPQVIDIVHENEYVKIVQQQSNLESYFAIFSLLLGEDKYHWDYPSCTNQEFADAAKVLALYHNTIYGWEGAQNNLEPRVVDQIPEMLNKWRMYLKSEAKSKFYSFF